MLHKLIHSSTTIKLTSSFIITRSISNYGLTHVKDSLPTMVDVSDKSITKRTATARGIVVLPPEVVKKLELNKNKNKKVTDLITKKGPIISTSIIAGVMASKNTSSLIPFCHPLALDDCKITMSLYYPKDNIYIDINNNNNNNKLQQEEEYIEINNELNNNEEEIVEIHINCSVKTTGKTGVEMEALTGVSVASLTLYDMLKALSHNIIIKQIELVNKTGGKSDFNLNKD